MIVGFLLCGLIASAQADPIRRPVLHVANTTTATEGQFPWQLVLTSTSSIHDCGAVLIEPNIALTAAHCMESLLPTFHVTGGQHNKDVASGNEVTLEVESFTKHPDFDITAAGFPNDIAILRLSDSFNTTGPYIKTIPMASANGSDFAGRSCTISGWGWSNLDNPRPTTLQYINTGCITNSECASTWTGIAGADINVGHICVYETDKIACVGDGGGPMVCDGVLAGTSSWQLHPCHDLFPIVFTRISHFRSWIDSNI